MRKLIVSSARIKDEQMYLLEEHIPPHGRRSSRTLSFYVNAVYMKHFISVAGVVVFSVERHFFACSCERLLLPLSISAAPWWNRREEREREEVLVERISLSRRNKRWERSACMCVCMCGWVVVGESKDRYNAVIVVQLREWKYTSKSVCMGRER